MVETGKMLEKNGYVIKSLNTINFKKSMHYNPFSYIRSEKDISMIWERSKKTKAPSLHCAVSRA